MVGRTLGHYRIVHITSAQKQVGEAERFRREGIPEFRGEYLRSSCTATEIRGETENGRNLETTR